MKDSHNHVPMNMICSSHTSRNILKDSDVPIFPVVLITIKNLCHSVTLLYHIIHFLCGGEYNFYMTLYSVPACDSCMLYIDHLRNNRSNYFHKVCSFSRPKSFANYILNINDIIRTEDCLKLMFYT